MKREHELLARYLDGELPREALPPELRAEADRFHGTFEDLRRERVVAPPWLRAAVMGRVRTTRPSGWRLALEWLLTPRLVRLTPATVVLVLVGGIAIASAVHYHPGTIPEAASPAGPGVVAEDDRVTTRFIFVAPEASRVAVTGDFVGWTRDGIPLERDPTGDGRWVAVVRLKPGVHEYAFVIDGTQWRPDPNAPQLDNGFGEKNSMLLVPARAES